MPAPTTVTELLAALVRINSVNPDLPDGGSEAAVVDAAEGWLRSWGIATQRLPVPGRGVRSAPHQSRVESKPARATTTAPSWSPPIPCGM